MARYLIVTWDGGGNATSAFGLGTRLRDRGHEVTMLGWRTMSGRASAAGFGFRTYPSLPSWPEGVAPDDAWDLLLRLLGSEETSRDVVDVAREVRPDVLVIDCMMASAFAAASHMRLPTVVLVHVMYRPYAFMWGDGLVPSLRAALDAADLVLALVPPGFDDPGEVPPNTRYVGPIAAPADGQWPDRWSLPLEEDGDPWVLVSLSTTLMDQRRALAPILDAVGSLPVRALLTLGGIIDTGTVVAPSNVVVRDYVPHAAVFCRISRRS